MKEIIRFWFLKRLIKDEVLCAEIYQMMYHRKPFSGYPIPYSFPTAKVPYPKEFFVDNNSVEEKTNLIDNQPKYSDRKKQLIDSLKVLMDKKIKTKQDKESIEILRAVLQNEK